MELTSDLNPLFRQRAWKTFHPLFRSSCTEVLFQTSRSPIEMVVSIGDHVKDFRFLVETDGLDHGASVVLDVQVKADIKAMFVKSKSPLQHNQNDSLQSKIQSPTHLFWHSRRTKTKKSCQNQNLFIFRKFLSRKNWFRKFWFEILEKKIS